MTILDFLARKESGQKISMMTCYDYSFAQILNQTDIDCLLVGDSLAMTMHGFSQTINATTDMMALHTAAVVKGAPQKLVIADMPFLANRKGLTAVMTSAEKIMQAGAQALKIEGAAGNLRLIRHLVDSGIPVMGHLGLTPQSVHMLGGFKVQGKDQRAKDKILEQSLQLQEAGCFGIVLECVPAKLAEKVTTALEIPTIGIGAGSKTDGQVLVLQDLLGMNQGFKPKFLKTYLDGHQLMTSAFNQFHKEVQSQKFPSEKESYGE